MKLVLVARDNLHMEGFQQVGQIVQSLLPQASIFMLCGERNRKLWKEDKQVINIFSEFEAFQNAYRTCSDSELSSKLANSKLPMTLFQSSPPYVYQEQSARDLVIEQLYIEEFVIKLFKEIRPSFVFSGAAAHLVWTVSLLVAEQLSIPSYRILNLRYLNPGSRGMRYWFTRNLESRLSSDPKDLMNWPRADVSEYVEKLTKTIRDRSYRLDHRAKTERRSRFISQGWKAIAIDLHRWLRGADRRAQWRLRAVVNNVQNCRLATPVDKLQTPFIVLPLNMPKDEQVTLRAPHLLDMFSSIEQIANVLPYGHTLVVKEHPVFPGMLDSGRLRRLLKRRANVKFVHNNTDIHDLLEKASILIAVNSTAAIDALVKGVPVVTLGESFYKGTGLTYDVEYMYQLSNGFKQALLDDKAEDRNKVLISVISRLFQESYPGTEVAKAMDPGERFNILARGIVRKIETYSSSTQSSQWVGEN